MSGKSDESSGIDLLSRAFKANPTLENYVKLRRANPHREIQVAISGGIDWLLAYKQTLNDFEVPPALVASALDANPSSISELSLILMERLIKRAEFEQTGKTHSVSRGEAIGDSLVNYLITMMLDSLDWTDDPRIPRDLIVLIRHQLGGDNSDWDKKLDAHMKRLQALFFAAQLIAKGVEPSYRNVGAALGVNATTVMRWFPDGQLIHEAKQLMPGIEFIERFVKERSERE